VTSVTTDDDRFAHLRTNSIAFTVSRTLLGCPEQFRKALYFTADVFSPSLFLSPGYLRAPSADRRETLPHDRNLGALYNASPKIRGPSPKDIGGQNAKFGPIFHTTSDFDREYLRNRTRCPKSKRRDHQRFLPLSMTKSPVNFGPLTTEYYMWVWTHRNWIFRETIFRPLGGTGPSNFNTHYRLTKACLRTPTTGTGSPKNLRANM